MDSRGELVYTGVPHPTGLSNRLRQTVRDEVPRHARQPPPLNRDVRPLALWLYLGYTVV